MSPDTVSDIGAQGVKNARKQRGKGADDIGSLETKPMFQTALGGLRPVSKKNDESAR